jgi:hypothetical protein
MQSLGELCTRLKRCLSDAPRWRLDLLKWLALLSMVLDHLRYVG